MARIALYKDNYADSTVVSNLFIDEYMKDANDAQLKVYFYLLRMLNAEQAISVSGIADKFNHTEKDVIRALKYWEKQQMKILRSRLYEAMQREQNEKIASERRMQVGTGDRSERIRTYNFPQGRMTDHRIGLTLYRLEDLLNGNLEEVFEALATSEQLKKLAAKTMEDTEEQ